MKSNSVSSAEDIEAIVRRVMADVLAKQQSGAASRTSSGSAEMLHLEDFEIPDDLDLGSIFTAVTLPNEIKDSLGKVEKNGGLNDADSIPDSLCDDTGERIGDLEQKLALSNASKDMVMEEIERLKSQAIDDCNELAEYRKENLSLIEEKEKLESAFIEVEEKVVLATDEIGHLKSVIEEQSQEIEDLNDACRGKAHIKAKIPEDKEKNTMTMIEEKDKFGNKIGGVEEKVVMAEDIARLKSVIGEQSQEIKDLNEASKKRAHLEVRLSEHLKSGLRIQAQMHAKMYAYQKKCMALVEERSKLEEKLRRQKHELAKLNKKVENSSNYKREVSVNSDLMAKSDRQKKELARLNKRVAELKSKASPETSSHRLELGSCSSPYTQWILVVLVGFIFIVAIDSLN